MRRHRGCIQKPTVQKYVMSLGSTVTFDVFFDKSNKYNGHECAHTVSLSRFFLSLPFFWICIHFNKISISRAHHFKVTVQHNTTQQQQQIVKFNTIFISKTNISPYVRSNEAKQWLKAASALNIEYDKTHFGIGHIHDIENMGNMQAVHTNSTLI